MNWITAALLIGAASFVGALGCSSSDSSSGGTGGASGSKGSSTAGASTAGAAAGSSSTGGTGTAGATAGSSSTGGASVGTGSAACQTYCACHEQNCATQAIPGGASCADFCAGMTADQLSCRQNMCGLVPAQPDNDHCKHSVGIDQCL